MKILVTGGCGFIGTNYIRRAISLEKHHIFNIDKLTYAGNPNNLLDMDSSKYKFLHGDITDLETVTKLINSYKPNAIINFAAETHVDRSIDSPLNFIHTNVLGTATILLAAEKFFNKNLNKNFKFLHISTDEVYGSLNSKGYFNENSPYDPSSPYSASKAAADHLVKSWYKTYNLPVLITNCSNNYGPYQFPEKLIPLIITNCLQEKTLPIYGKGENIRDWLFVDDHCDAIENVLKLGKSGETYNIGGNNEFRNIDIVQTICMLLDEIKPRKNGLPYHELINFVPDRPGHDYRYAIDASKINNHLGWKPKETFKTGIKKTIKWYIDNENWWK